MRRAPRLGRTWAAAVTCALGAVGFGCGGETLVPPHQGLAMRDVSFAMRDLQFPSGLRVIAERDDRSPLVALVLVVGTGAAADPPGKEGLAHYVEHLAFRSRPFGKSSFARLLERAGAGRFNAFTSQDATVFYEIGPTSSLNELLRLEGTRMLAPVAQVSPDTAGVELNVVRNELRLKSETGFAGEAVAALQAAVFPAGSSYARPVGGTQASLSAIGTDDLASFLSTHYRPDNMTLVIIGDLNLDSIARTVAEELPPELMNADGPASRAARMSPRAPEAPAVPPARPLRPMAASVATPEIWIAWSTPRGFDVDAYLLEFTRSLALAALEAARRDDDDIAAIDASVAPGKDASMIVGRLELVSGRNPQRTLEHVLDAVDKSWKFADSALGESMGEFYFEMRRRGSVVRMLREAEDLTEHGMARAMSTHFTRDPAVYTRRLRALATTDWKRSTEYAHRYLTRDRARAILLTPATGQIGEHDSLPMGAAELEDEPPPLVNVDAARLSAMAPTPGNAWLSRFTLKNGLEVITLRRAGLPLVSAGLMFFGGPRVAADPAAAALGWRLAAARGHEHGDAELFGGQLVKIEGADTAQASIEGASGNVAIMLAILAERMTSLDVTEESWEQIEKVIPFLRALEQRPEAVAARAFQTSLLAGSPSGRSLVARDLASRSADAARSWMKETIVPRNAVLAVVGEFEPAEVQQIVTEQFGEWDASGPRAPAPPALDPGAAAAPRPALVVTSRPGATQSQIRFGCLLAPAWTSMTDAQHDLLAKLLEERLKQRLRQRLGITYGVRVVAAALRGGTAFLQIDSAVDAPKTGVALGVIKDVLGEVDATLPSDNELSWAKLRLAGSREARFMTNDGSVASLLGRVDMGWSLDGLGALGKELAAATPADVQRELHTCLARRPTLAIVGDEPSVRAAFREAWP